MSRILHLLGIRAIAVGHDLNACMFGIKYDNEEGCVEEEPEAKAFFIFLGPIYILFIV